MRFDKIAAEFRNINKCKKLHVYKQSALLSDRQAIDFLISHY